MPKNMKLLAIPIFELCECSYMGTVEQPPDSWRETGRRQLHPIRTSARFHSSVAQSLQLRLRMICMTKGRMTEVNLCMRWGFHYEM